LLSWFLLSLSLPAGSALSAARWFEVVTWPFLALNQPEVFATALETDRHPRRTDKLKPNDGYHLAFRNSNGAVNYPLPLGIVVNNSFGGETLVLSDLAEGTKLSAGTTLGATRWSVPGRDLDKAFIAAPENFSGSMQVTAKLYSSDNLVLETKEIRFEWTGSQTEDRAANIALTKATPLGMPDLGADGKDRIRSSNGSGHGTDAPTTGEYSESFARRWDPMRLANAADWLSQVSPVLLPAVDHPIGQTPLAQPSTSPPSIPAALLERGERLLREGNVAAARPLLRRAADGGRADAALDLGMSFDPSFVPYGNPGGATADPAEAARWYKRALKLGRKDVAADLERVTNMTKNKAPR
jgi:hypothetical protein